MFRNIRSYNVCDRPRGDVSTRTRVGARCWLAYGTSRNFTRSQGLGITPLEVGARVGQAQSGASLIDGEASKSAELCQTRSGRIVPRQNVHGITEREDIQRVTVGG